MEIFDVIIIGGGPIGIACGIEAEKRGLSYLILEKGCIVNSLYNYPDNMTFFSSSDKLEIDEIPFISVNPRPYKSEALEYYRRIVTSNHLNMNLFEEVTDVKQIPEGRQLTTTKSSYTARNIVIATGFYDIPKLMDVPGENLPKVSHYYKNPHFYSRQKVVVVGSSNSSVDAALEIYRKGGDVTLVIRGKGIGERVKYWVKPDIENRIKEGSIKAIYNTEVEEITEKEVIIRTKDERMHIPNDYVLALTGYMPNFDFLLKIGIEISDDETKRPSHNPLTMESNLAGVYLAGVVCGGMETHKWFIENSRVHANIIMEDIKAKAT